MHSVPDRPRPRLASTPRLLGAYYTLRNRWRRRNRGDRVLLAGAVLLWAAPVAWLAGCSRAALLDSCAWLSAHGLELGAAGFAGAVVLVSRRRSVVRAEATRSWLAALAVTRGSAFLEARTLEWAPACAWLGMLAVAGVSLLAVAAGRDIGSLHGVMKTAGTLVAAVVVGGLCSYLIPPGRDEDLPPGSRYVPHRRRLGPPLPKASQTGLAEWPVRQLFATLRPKVVTRAVVPVLLAVPLGATADSALLMLGVTAISAALLLLIVSVARASHDAARWLRPAPVRPSVLCRALLTRVLVALGLLAAAWGILAASAGMTASDATLGSAALWVVCAALAVGLTWFATHRRVGG